MSRAWIERLWGPAGLRLLVGDLGVIAVLLGALGMLGFPGGERGRPDRAEVDVAGRGVLSLDINRNGSFDVAGHLGVVRIEVRDRRVRILSSPCARQVCRHSGWIEEAGEVLVCLPNMTVVRLPGRRAGTADAVSR